jgi:bifunctional UDP-N-acetylglucosamine pyrophosphorylase/glucosamine-1-phosphate N-acetyltransferase
MAQGVTLYDPTRFDCRGYLQAGTDVVIDINAVFEGSVTLGNNVYIEPNCYIKNSDIGNNVTIKANSVIEDATVGNNCDVGPFARLRPETVLEDNARVGNFVEVKKSTLGRGSKANHLAYIGDAEVGEGSNIGAGTITCNYDGVNKHRTTIGDDVFIGSNSTLVAPVNIEDGGFVGAGSTVTKDVPRDNLAVGRGKQRNIEGWQKPGKKKE